MPLPLTRSRLAVCATLLLASSAHARPGPHAAEGQVAMVAPDGLTGGRYVGSARLSDQTLRLSSGAGYAYTGNVLGQNDGHHRALLSVGGAAVVAPWLQCAVTLGLRHDAHTGPHDEGTAGETSVRTRHRLLDHEHGALAIGAGFYVPPGDDVGLSLRATSLAAELIGSLAPSSRSEFAATLGYRVERSAAALREPTRRSAPDRLGSGASADDALYLGMSASRVLGPVHGMLEWSWELYTQGPNAALDGPMRLRAALQKRVGERFTPGAEIAVRTLRAPAFQGVMRIEPALAVQFTLAVSLDERATPVVVAPKPPPRGAPTQAPVALPEPPPAPSSELQGTVRAERGRAILATIDVLERNETIHTDAEGRFRLAVEPGSYTLRVSAAGYESEVRRALVEAEGVTILVVELARSK